MADLTEAEVTRDLAYEAASPAVLERGKHYAWRQPDGAVHEVDLSEWEPARKAGTVTVRDVASLGACWDKHHDDSSEAFADIDAATVTAVLDAHRSAADGAWLENGGARWQQHRAVLRLKVTLAWETWLEKDRQMMPQVAFAEFLEDNYLDLDPSGDVRASDFLEMAQHLQAATKVKFASGTRLSSGETKFTWEETTEARSAGGGEIIIPTTFGLAIRPYEDCETALIAARFRYRIKPEGLFLGYFLNQPERHRREAVENIAAQVAERIAAPVLRGIPA